LGYIAKVCYIFRIDSISKISVRKHITTQGYAGAGWHLCRGKVWGITAPYAYRSCPGIREITVCEEAGSRLRGGKMNISLAEYSAHHTCTCPHLYPRVSQEINIIWQYAKKPHPEGAVNRQLSGAIENKGATRIVTVRCYKAIGERCVTHK